MAGNRSKWESNVAGRLDLITAWARDGLIEAEMCKRLGVGVSTFNVYKNEHSELREALKNGKEISDYHVEDSLYKRAIGFTYEETTREPVLVEKQVNGEKIKTMLSPKLVVTKVVTKHVIPDTAACVFWLCNRKKKEWRNVSQVEYREVSEYEDMSPDALQAEVEKLSKEIARADNLK